MREEDYRSTDHLLYNEYILILSLLTEWDKGICTGGRETAGCMEGERAREEEGRN